VASGHAAGGRRRAALEQWVPRRVVAAVSVEQRGHVRGDKGVGYGILIFVGLSVTFVG
jgi:hypothetical protein